ncbi:MAG TPA: hypothetical protein VIG53_07895 [Actinomycetota bacterium]|jgi:hypothetical protein
MNRAPRWIASAAALVLLAAACGSTSTDGAVANPTTAAPVTSAPTTAAPATPSETAISPEPAVPTESNPPGDIPDNIAFVPYRTKGGVTVSTPEGWARTTTGNSVTFTDKLNTVRVSWGPGSAPTVAAAKRTYVPALAASERAFTLIDVSGTTLPAGNAVVIHYEANSAPDPVTNKQYRLDVVDYALFKDGRVVHLTLLSPVGSDNVDPWRIVTESLKWA